MGIIARGIRVMRQGMKRRQAMGNVKTKLTPGSITRSVLLLGNVWWCPARFANRTRDLRLPAVLFVRLFGFIFGGLGKLDDYDKLSPDLSDRD